MKRQSLFSGKNKKNIINLLFAEFAHRVVKFKYDSLLQWISSQPHCIKQTIFNMYTKFEKTSLINC